MSLFIANWKMNPATLQEAKRLFNLIGKKIKNIKNTEIIICPPFIYLEPLFKLLQTTPMGRANYPNGARKLPQWGAQTKLGAQDVFWEEKGAFTGEVSTSMLKEVGCEYVIIGHSERRQYLKETDEMINKKIKICLKFNLKPILCIGEKFLKTNKPSIIEQIKKDLKGISQKEIKKVIIVYEPIWAISAISKGKFCSPKRAVEKIKIIRNILNSKFKACGEQGRTIQNSKLLYGGSVDSANIKSFISQPTIDGVLVGGASLKKDEVKKMLEIINQKNKKSKKQENKNLKNNQ